MAIGTPVHRGSAGIRNSSAANLNVFPDTELASGTVCWVRVAFDNISTADGATDDISVPNVLGNVFSKVWERTETSGSVNDGTTSALLYSILGTAIPTSQAVSILTTDNVQTRLGALVGATIGGTLAWATITPGTHTQGSTDADVDLTFTYSGLPSRDYLAFFSGSIERSDGGWLVDGGSGDYTELTKVFTSGGAQATNQTGYCAYRFLTGTGDTFTFDVNADAEYVGGYVFFYEEAAAVGSLPPVPVGRTWQDNLIRRSSGLFVPEHWKDKILLPV